MVALLSDARRMFLTLLAPIPKHHSWTVLSRIPFFFLILLLSQMSLSLSLSLGETLDKILKDPGCGNTVIMVVIVVVVVTKSCRIAFDSKPKCGRLMCDNKVRIFFRSLTGKIRLCGNLDLSNRKL